MLKKSIATLKYSEMAEILLRANNFVWEQIDYQPSSQPENSIEIKNPWTLMTSDAFWAIVGV